jgi:ABC-type transporter Mla subunit MlaD
VADFSLELGATAQPHGQGQPSGDIPTPANEPCSPSPRLGTSRADAQLYSAALQKGSGVSLLGVPIGRVTEVRLEPANSGLVTVRFVLTRDVPLRRGVTASIARSLLDGSATISLEGGDIRAPALAGRPGQPFPLVPVKSGGLLGSASIW